MAIDVDFAFVVTAELWLCVFVVDRSKNTKRSSGANTAKKCHIQYWYATYG